MIDSRFWIGSRNIIMSSHVQRNVVKDVLQWQNVDQYLGDNDTGAIKSK